ncbi:hypothetical protein BCR43DRAFT_564976 [Syncephalastrum racemosum]|uniref:Kinesin motor domain-containing protein n=1 Tax=Syncephalastrum racemosum TaxID=13706 RepID=A0A1X2H811_SYNRA|nr:hypothetical protein BCR43DRAFT_564976 [Syncephalastrum racemosum]
MAKEAHASAVQVALRIRPLTEKDRAQPRFANASEGDVLKAHDKTVHVVPHNKLFTFDHVFGTNSTQSQVFAALGHKSILKFIEGYNVTILAYGQTSSGKTYTMGTAQHQSGRYNTQDEGIVPRAMALLFDTLQHQDHSNSSNHINRPVTPSPSISSSTDTSTTKNRLRPPSRISKVPHTTSNSNNNSTNRQRYTVKVSFVEIYNEELNDLLNDAPPGERPPITIREDAKGHIYWTGVKELPVHSTDDVLYFLEQGTRNRATGSTDMNEKSSRSHAIFSVSLRQEKWVPSPTPTQSSSGRKSAMNSRNDVARHDDGEYIISTSKFHFVDLAGSERLKRTAAEGDRRKEGININAGLLALGNVISALGDTSKKSTHVPYRDSKLTRLLQDSLGGSATTLMIACVSPVEYNLSETLNTLGYANRARNIKNRIEKNEVEEWMTTDNLDLLRNMISKLKTELRVYKSGSISSATTVVPQQDTHGDLMTPTSNNDSVIDEDHLRQLIADLQRQVEELDGEASVTRERNRVVEAELKRLRKMESMRSNDSNMDFQHLVEPVIEEYEKSISSLESQLAMARAALNHSDMGMEEQQGKMTHYENLLEAQSQTVEDLRSRLAKVTEREHNNESYIEELEGKLMRSSNEALRDQELLNELKNRIMKLKETDENTEQYIFDLEQRLATSEAEKSRLSSQIEKMEEDMASKVSTNAKLQQRLSRVEDTDTQKMILKELDDLTARFQAVEQERDVLKAKVDAFEEQRGTNGTSSEKSVKTDATAAGTAAATLASEMRAKEDEDASRRKGFRRSYAEEKETPSSLAAVAAQKAEQRAQEEAARAMHLEREVRQLTEDHRETVKELDEVMLRYQETLEQLELLQHTPIPDDPSAHDGTDALSKEMSRAKEEEQVMRLEQIAKLEQYVGDLEAQIDSNQFQLKEMAKLEAYVGELEAQVDETRRTEQKLEQELKTANDRCRILQEMVDDQTEADSLEETLRELELARSNSDKAKKSLERDLEAQRAELAQVHDAHQKLTEAHAATQRELEKRTLSHEEALKKAAEAHMKAAEQLKTEHAEQQKMLQGELKALQARCDTLIAETGVDKSDQMREELTKTLQELQARNDELSRAHAALVQTHGELSQTHEMQATELAAKTQELEKLLQVTRQHEVDSARLVELQRMLQVKDTEIQQMQLQLAKVNETSEDELQQQRALLENRLQSSKERVSELGKAAEASHTRVGELEAALLDKDARYVEQEKRYHAQLKELETALQAKNDAVQSLRTELNEAVQERDKMASRLAELEVALLDKGAQGEVLQKKHDVRVREVEATAKAKDDELQALTTRLEEAIQSRDEHQVRLSELETSLLEKGIHGDELKKVHDARLTEIATLTEKLDTVTQARDTQKARVAELERALSETGEVSTAHKSRLRELEAADKVKTDQMQSLSSKLQEAIKMREEKERRLAELKEKLRSKEEEMQVLHEDLEDVSTALTESEAARRKAEEEQVKLLDQVTQENSQLATRNQELEEVLSNAKEELEQKESALQSTVHDMEQMLVNSDAKQTSSQEKITHLETLLARAANQALEADKVLQARLAEMESSQISASDVAETRLQEKEQELARATASVRHLEAEKQSLQQKLDEQTVAYRKADTDLASLRAAAALDQERLAKVSTELSNVTHALQEAKREVEACHAAATKAERHIEKLEHDVSALQTSNDEKDSSLRHLRSQVETHARTIGELRDQLEQAEFVKQVQTVDNAGDQQGLYEKRIAHLEAKAKRFEDENLEYVTLSEEMEGQVSSLMKQVESLTQQMEEGEQELEEYAAKVEELETALAEAEQNHQAWQQREQTLESDKAKLQAAVSELEMRCDALSKDLVEARQSQHQLQPSPSEPADMESLDTAKADAAKHKANADRIQDELIQTQGRLAQVQEQLTSLQEQHTQVRQESAAQLQEATKRHKKLEQDLATEKKHHAQAQRSISQLESQLEELMRKKNKFLCL